MQITARGRRFEIEYQSLIVSTLIWGWALYYYFTTVHIPDGGEESVLFIKPLVIILSLCFPFVIKSSIKVMPLSVEENESTEKKLEQDRGFLDDRRIIFAGCLFAYAIGLTFLGYLIPSILFIIVVCFYLGVRSLWVLIGLPIALSTFTAIVFHYLIRIPIPIWPW